MSTELTWIGQAGFLLSTPATRLAVDPFLSGHPDRRFPSPVGVADLAGTELVLATHQHLDHLDAPALRDLPELDDQARVVVPAPAVPDAVEDGLPPDRLVGARPGEPIAAGDVTVHPVPALHGVHVTDAYSHGLPADGDQVRYSATCSRPRTAASTTPATRCAGTARPSCSGATGSTSPCCRSTAATSRRSPAWPLSCTRAAGWPCWPAWSGPRWRR